MSGPLSDSSKKNPESSAFCPNCGKQVLETHKFCRHCGEDLRDDTPEPKSDAGAKFPGQNKKAGKAGSSDGKKGADAKKKPGKEKESGSGEGKDGDEEPKKTGRLAALKPLSAAAVLGSRKKRATEKTSDSKPGPVGASSDGTKTGAADDKRGSRLSRSRGLVLGGTLVAVSALAVVVLFLTGVIGSGTSESEVQAFDEGMDQRQELLLADHNYSAAMRSANRTVKRYYAADAAYDAEVKRIDDANQPLYDACQNEFSNISCPNPTYPDTPKVPTVADQVSDLRKVEAAMETLGATIRSVDPPDALKTFYAQLTASVDQLQEDATYNADTLTKAVIKADGEMPGNLDRNQVSTLKSEKTLPSLRALNAEALALVKQLGLNPDDYDVPGGDDVNPDDASHQT